MNGKLSLIICLAVVVVAAALADAHKNRLYQQPQFEGPRNDRCICDCAGGPGQPILPNKPYYGSGGYAQPPPRPNGGYGNSGGYAVSGSYGSGGSQVSGGY